MIKSGGNFTLSEPKAFCLHFRSLLNPLWGRRGTDKSGKPVNSTTLHVQRSAIDNGELHAETLLQ
jgi:hypothetical protein